MFWKNSESRYYESWALDHYSVEKMDLYRILGETKSEK